MKTNQLFKVLAVLSPMVLTATFSPAALAETQQKQEPAVVLEVSQEAKDQAKIETSELKASISSELEVAKVEPQACPVESNAVQVEHCPVENVQETEFEKLIGRAPTTIEIPLQLNEKEQREIATAEEVEQTDTEEVSLDEKTAEQIAAEIITEQETEEVKEEVAQTSLPPMPKPAVRPEARTVIEAEPVRVANVSAELKTSIAKQMQQNKQQIQEDVKRDIAEGAKLNIVSDAVEEVVEVKKEEVTDVQEQEVEEVADVQEQVVEEVADVQEQVVEEVADVQEQVVEEVTDVQEQVVEEVADVQEQVVEEVADSEFEDTVKKVTEEATDLKNNVEAIADSLTAEDTIAAKETIEEVEKEVEEVKKDVAEANDEKEDKKEEMLAKLEKAEKELAEAKEALKKKEKRIAAIEEEKVSINKAYCSLQTRQDDLVTEMEKLKESILNPMNSSMQAMMQLMAMNMMGAAGPNYIESLGSKFERMNSTRGQNGSSLGVQMLSLTDLFNAKSMGGINYNVYNVGGNLIGGDFTQAFAPNYAYQSEQGARVNLGQTNPYSLLGNNQYSSEGFNFEQGVNDLSRANFMQLDAQNSNQARQRVEANINTLNNGGNLFPMPATNPAVTQGPAPAAATQTATPADIASDLTNMVN